MTATQTRPAAPAAKVTARRDREDVRRTLLALLASGLGIAPLCELLTDRGWLIDVWLTMIIVIAPAALLRLRRPPSAGQIWIGLVLMVPWLTLRFVGEHAYGHVVPLQASWHDIGALITDLHHTTTVETAPIHSTVGIRLALCALLGLVAALVDLVAVVGRRGALAGIPLLVVFTVSGAVPRSPVGWWLFAIAAAAFLILLALDSSDDLHRWGHFVPRSGSARRRPVAGGSVSAQRIAAAAIALAVLLPAFIPADSRNLIANWFHDGSGSGLGAGFGRSGTGGIDPFVALKGQLNRKDPIDLFDVNVQSLSGDLVGLRAAVQPFYLRENVLSQFTGSGWKPGTNGELEDLVRTQFASSPGVGFPPNTVEFRTRVSIKSLGSNPPIFAIPTQVGGLAASSQWSKQDQLIIGETVSKGDAYDLIVRQPTPTTADLQAAIGHDPAMDPWLQLPPIAESVQRQVEQLTAGAITPYDRARALSDFFAAPANRFTYSLSTAPGDSGDDLVDFLKNRVGYCQQYAAALGVMLRLAGVPSRVVLGYAHPVPDRDGNFTVTTNDAHSWVEAYFDGIGWVPFDPTPLAGISGGSTNDLPWAPHPRQAGASNDVPTIRPSTGTGSRNGSSSAAPGPRAGAANGGGPSVVAALTGTGIVASVLVVLLAPWAVRQRRRRGRLRRVRHAGDTDALWAELSDTALDLGFVWSRSRTPRQVAAWLAEPAGSASGSLRAMAAAVERTRYAPGMPAADGRRLAGELAAVRDGLSAGHSFGQRLRTALWPRSLGWRGLRRRRH